MNSKFSYTDGLLRSKNKITWVLLSVVLLIVIIIFTNVEYFLLVAKGSKAGWHIFAIYYLLELAFLCVCYFWLFPKLLSEVMNRPILLIYIPIILTVAPLLSVLLRIFIYHLYERSLTFSELKIAFADSLYRHTHILFFALVLFLVRLVISYVISNRKYKMMMDGYEVEKKNLQSVVLGIQMNPHLMINVLNAVQGNILEKSPESFHLIHNLTSIHEHILTKSTSEGSSTLADEIELIRRIVALYSSIGKELGQIELPSILDAEKMEFPANLINPLVENIYKHADFIDTKSLPEVRLSLNGPYLKLYIWNKVLGKPVFQNRRSLGLANCLQRLKFHFPNRFEFNSVSNNGVYILTLAIKLTEND